MNRRSTPIGILLFSVLALGAGGGAATYAAIAGSHTTTIVRQVAVRSSQPAASTTAGSVGQVYRDAYRGVVELTVTATSQGQGFPFGPQSSQAQGSGLVYDSAGHIVTNQHVVAGASSVSVRFWNGKTVKATIVGTDPSTDLAVIKVSVDPSLLHPLTLDDSTKVAVGDGVVAIGSPFGLEETVTAGIVSALHRQMTSPNNYSINDSIQTDAAINHGNSGGPLLDLAGNVIGVNAQIGGDTGGNEGVGFAIPSNTIKSVVTQLLASGSVKHAYLGVVVASVPNNGGARISTVRGSAPAKAAGLHAGDVITAVDSSQVASAQDLQVAVEAHAPGSTVTVTFKRGGSTHTTKVKLGNRPS